MEKTDNIKELYLPAVKPVSDDIRRFMVEMHAEYDKKEGRRKYWYEFMDHYVRTDNRFREWQKQNK